MSDDPERDDTHVEVHGDGDVSVEQPAPDPADEPADDDSE